MANSPQSSRDTQKLGNQIFPNVSPAKLAVPAYYAAKFFTQSGETDIKIKEKENANGLHYIIGAAIIVAVVLVANHKLS